jgi:hypothetical protein
VEPVIGPAPLPLLAKLGTPCLSLGILPARQHPVPTVSSSTSAAHQLRAHQARTGSLRTSRRAALRLIRLLRSQNPARSVFSELVWWVLLDWCGDASCLNLIRVSSNIPAVKAVGLFFVRDKVKTSIGRPEEGRLASVQPVRAASKGARWEAGQ